MLESARGRRSTRRRRSMDPALGGGRLSFGQKLARLGQRMHDPEWRRYARLVFAGKILGYSRNTTYEAVKNGQLPVIRLGRKIRVPKVALKRMLRDLDAGA